MKKLLTLGLLIIAIFISNSICATELWTPVDKNQIAALTVNTTAARFLAFNTNEATLKAKLFSLSGTQSNSQILPIPQSDGTIRNFYVWKSSIFPDELSARYPDIMTWTGVATDDQTVTVKIDFTVYGFHAMIFNGSGIDFFDPADDNHTGLYTVHSKTDEIRKFVQSSKCNTVSSDLPSIEPALQLSKNSHRISNGYTQRKYVLALACSHQYAQAATGLSNPTIAQVLSKMTTTMNRVNGIYERELSVTMIFASNENNLIFPTENGSVNGHDTFSSWDSDPNTCLQVNQYFCDNRIGKNNYDIGHVFTTNGGGLSQIGVVCDSFQKAMSVTGQAAPTGDGFDIDYVAHEMGHEFGGNHTFNNGVDGYCGGGNIVIPVAFEPGSGSTIMAYAGICAPDDLQLHSDDYFHAVSLYEIQLYISTSGNWCADHISTGNKLAQLPTFSASYTIPYLTPFELVAPTAVDSVGGAAITYCWEQWNLGDSTYRLKDTHYRGPIFRSFTPVKSPTRVFPKNSMVLAGRLNDAGQEANEGEKVPDVSRYLTFKLTVRNILNGFGCFLFPDDTIHLQVINTGDSFRVTSQDDSTAVYVGGSTHEISWKVAGTAAAPINCANVDIYMSEDGGYTWPHHIGAFPNTGSAILPLPNPAAYISNQARLKVKGENNVFFNVNKYNFSLTHNDGTDTLINLYPNPVHTTLRLSSGNKGVLSFHIVNSVGKLIYAGTVDGLLDIPVSSWPRDVYIVKFIDIRNNRTVKKFVVD